MHDCVVLVSDDNDFFEFIVPMLSLRKSDELYRFSFDSLLEKLNMLDSALFIINAENMKEKTLDLLSLIQKNQSIVFTYNYDEEFAVSAYKLGLFEYLQITTSEQELNAKLLSAFNALSIQKKNNIYRDILVNNKLISPHNEVFLDYCKVLDRELVKINNNSTDAVLLAISPNEETKFKLQPYQIETAILNNIRNDDILMNFGINKYFLLLNDSSIEQANKILNKIENSLPHKIYAGIISTSKKNRQQLVSEALNKLHESINKNNLELTNKNTNVLVSSNFKLFKQEFNKKIENIISPVFYMVQQKYNNQLFGMTIEQGSGEGYGVLYIKSKYSSGSFRITSPGLSKINIDISYQLNENVNEKSNKIPEAKRISIEPEELESGLLEDLLEQFISEFKSEVNYENIE